MPGHRPWLGPEKHDAMAVSDDADNLAAGVQGKQGKRAGPRLSLDTGSELKRRRAVPAEVGAPSERVMLTVSRQQTSWQQTEGADRDHPVVITLGLDDPFEIAFELYAQDNPGTHWHFYLQVPSSNGSIRIDDRETPRQHGMHVGTGPHSIDACWPRARGGLGRLPSAGSAAMQIYVRTPDGWGAPKASTVDEAASSTEEQIPSQYHDCAELLVPPDSSADELKRLVQQHIAIELEDFVLHDPALGVDLTGPRRLNRRPPSSALGGECSDNHRFFSLSVTSFLGKLGLLEEMMSPRSPVLPAELDYFLVPGAAARVAAEWQLGEAEARKLAAACEQLRGQASGYDLSEGQMLQVKWVDKYTRSSYGDHVWLCIRPRHWHGPAFFVETSIDEKLCGQEYSLQYQIMDWLSLGEDAGEMRLTHQGQRLSLNFSLVEQSISARSILDVSFTSDLNKKRGPSPLPPPKATGWTVLPKKMLTALPKTLGTAVKVATLEWCCEELSAEATRGREHGAAAQRALGYLDEMRQRAVSVRRFAAAAVGNSGAVTAHDDCSGQQQQQQQQQQVLLEQSLAALEGRMELCQLQLRASKSVEWQTRAQAKERENEAIRYELKAAEAAASSYRERLRQMERAQAAKAAAKHAAATEPATAAHAMSDTGRAGQTGSMVAQTVASEELSVAERVIESIRKGKLIGEDIPPEMQPAVEAMRGMCGRALEKLGKDLYSHESHFFSELLQNADDNKYADDCTPALAVRICDASITLLNNEVGFTASDVRSVCDLGASTKVGSSGSIGRKGIGFKSVFMVSDTPQVLSKNRKEGVDWSFKFDTLKYGAFGLVCPEVIPAGQTLGALLPASRQALEQGAWTTAIHLPRRNQLTSLGLKQRFECCTLLFLRKIRKLSVDEDGVVRHVQAQETASPTSNVPDSIGGRLSHYIVCDRLEDTTSGEIHSATTEVTVEYVVYKRTGIRPPASVSQCSSDARGQITIAVPVTGTLAPRSFFTFLPVQSAGFPFPIHANMELTASRQQVHQNSSWNLWLRDQLAPTFVQMMNRSEIVKGRVAEILSAAQVNLDFFLPVLREIVGSLRDTACIFTEGGNWVKPISAMRRPAHSKVDCRAEDSLVTNAQLQRACDLEFVHSSCTEIAERLKCKEFGLDSMLEVVSEIGLLEITRAHTAESRLPEFYAFLHHAVGQDERDTGRLWNEKIFVVADAQADLGVAPSSPAEGAVFSSLKSDWSYLQETGIIRVMAGLTPEQPSAHCEAVIEECQKFLETMGVQSADPCAVVELIVNHHSQGTLKSVDACWNSLIFVQQHLEVYLDGSSLSSMTREHRLQLLRTSLLAPCYDGSLVAVAQLSVRGILGVECPCVGQNRPKHEAPVSESSQCMCPSNRRSVCTSLSSADKLELPGTVLVRPYIAIWPPPVADVSEKKKRGNTEGDAKLCRGTAYYFYYLKRQSELSPRPSDFVEFGKAIGAEWISMDETAKMPYFAQVSRGKVPGEEEGDVPALAAGMFIDSACPIEECWRRGCIRAVRKPDRHLFEVQFEDAEKPEILMLRPGDDDWRRAPITAQQQQQQDTTSCISTCDMELFLLAMGARPHSHICGTDAARERWLEIAEVQQCSICLEDMDLTQPSTLCKLSCSHRYHMDCISVVSTNRGRCPLCRGRTTTNLRRERMNNALSQVSAAVASVLKSVCVATAPICHMMGLHKLCADKQSRDIMSAAAVPTSLGKRSLRTSFFLEASLVSALDTLLPRLRLQDGSRTVSIASDLTPEQHSLLLQLGCSSATDLDGLLKAAVAMKSSVIDRDNRRTNVESVAARTAAFASLYSNLQRCVEEASPERKSQCILTIVNHFRSKALIYVGARDFVRSDGAVWNGSSAVATSLNKVVIGGIYGQYALEEWFRKNLGLEDISARDCWKALSQLDAVPCHLIDRVKALKSVVADIYGELERMLVDRDGHVKITGFDCGMYVLGQDYSAMLVKPMSVTTKDISGQPLASPIVLNDDTFAHDVFAEQIENWALSTADDGSSVQDWPSLFAMLVEIGAVRLLSRAVSDRGGVTIAEPVVRQPDWSLWLRSAVAKVVREICGGHTSTLTDRLGQSLEVFSASKISVQMQLLLKETASAAGGDYRTNQVSYEHFSQVETGRIIIAATAMSNSDRSWTCARLAQELTLFLSELWHGSGAICERRTLEWTIFAHLLRLCGLQPRQLPTEPRRGGGNGSGVRPPRLSGFSMTGTDVARAAGSSRQQPRAAKFSKTSVVHEEPLDSATYSAMLQENSSDEHSSSELHQSLFHTAAAANSAGTEEDDAVVIESLHQQVATQARRIAELEDQLSLYTARGLLGSGVGQGGRRRSHRRGARAGSAADRNGR